MRKQRIRNGSGSSEAPSLFNQIYLFFSTSSSKGVVVLVGTLLLAGLACNLPLGSNSETAPVDDQLSFKDQIFQDIGIDVSDIYLQGDQVVVTYDSPWTQDEASMLTDWLGIMIQALETDSSTLEVRIDVNHLNDPLYSITSTRANVENLMNERVGISEFYENLQFGERRTPEQVLKEKITFSGFQLGDVKVDNGTVAIDIFQQPASTTTDVLLEWIRLLDMAVTAVPDSEQIILTVIYPNSPEAQLEVKAEDILGYREGNLSPAEFLARLKPAL